MRASFHLLSVIFLVAAGRAQTTCSLSQTEPGVHLCFPSASTATEVPPLLHISAQINAPEGKQVSGYTIKVDDIAVGLDVERVPVHQLAVEGTLGMPLAPGKHSLKIEAGGVGEISTKIIVRPIETIVPCESVTNFPQWVCTSRPIRRTPAPASHVANLGQPPDASLSFEQFTKGLLKEFEALQLDSMEVAALDDAGNIYTATHTLSDIEVRKYGPGGERLQFATVISSCGPGFTALDSIAIAPEGQVWLSGHSTACFQPTATALDRGSARATREGRSFLLRVNTNLNGTPPLAYFSFLPDAARGRISGLRVDRDGNVYIAGSTSSSSFPHQHALSFGAHNATADPLSFVALLKADGSTLLNSALLQGIHVSALAVDKDTIAIAGTGQSSASTRARAASCCSVLLATLRSDLSAITSVTTVPQQGNGFIPALAVTSTNALMAVSYAMQPIPAAAKEGTIRKVIYAWTPNSARACSELITGSPTPRIIDSPSLDAYSRRGNSNAFCKPEPGKRR